MITNNIRIWSEVDGVLVSHFLLSEFANKEGWVVIHERVPWALEQIRAALNARYPNDEIIILVTNITRTKAQNAALAARLGWTDEGGLVSRRSWHLVEFGGIAVDFEARVKSSGVLISPVEVSKIAALYFEWVKWYSDGHVHGDFRGLFTE